MKRPHLYTRTPRASGLSISDFPNKHGYDHRGYVVTEWGVVGVFSWYLVYSDGMADEGALLEVEWCGTLYDLRIPHYVRPRRLVTLAKRFAEAAANDVGEDDIVAEVLR